MPLTAARRPPFRAALAALTTSACGSVPALAQSPPTAAPPLVPAGLEACAQLRDDAQRLACYDRFVAPRTRAAADPQAAAGGAAGLAQPSAAAAASAAPRARCRRRRLVPRRVLGALAGAKARHLQLRRLPTELLLSGPRHQSRAPLRQQPDAGRSGDLPDYERYEAKFQLSIRTKLVEGLLLPNADLWFSYTQQSLWQIYSAGISRPFRAIDHEPELFYLVPTPYALPFGFQARMVGLGLAHQSNGDTKPLSRSWNRWYVLGGIERGDVTLTARVNTRFSERGDDDNPDFTRYRGRHRAARPLVAGLLHAERAGQDELRFRPRLGAARRHDAGQPQRSERPALVRAGLQRLRRDAHRLQLPADLVRSGVSLFGW